MGLRVRELGKISIKKETGVLLTLKLLTRNSVMEVDAISKVGK